VGKRSILVKPSAMISRTVALASLGLAMAVHQGCEDPVTATASEARIGSSGSRPVVVATTGMIGDLVRGVVGDRGDVVVLMGEGVDPHLFAPTASDVRRLLAADVVFHNGLMLEGRMGTVLSNDGGPIERSIAVAEVIPEASLLHPDDAANHADPHVWMDVKAWSATIEPIVRALCDLDPGGCEGFKANGRMLRDELARLDRYATTVMDSIPSDQRVLVTAHDAFGYFGRAYGVEVHGIQGLSTESEAGLADMNRLVRMLADRGIPAVFVESSVSEKNVMALVEGAASLDHDVIVGGELYSDAMGAPGAWEGTYPGMIDHNVTTIGRALGGRVPDGGYRGWRDRLDAASDGEATD
jgi:manganese/zinc/iron transport system substrate-binding protein